MFDIVEKFENTIADFFGSPYAVAVDCCTHGIELALRLQQIKKTSCPAHTYVSIPMTLQKLGIEWSWIYTSWSDYYFFNNTNIADAAVLWKENSYISGSIMILSFQFKKHLSLGRGGMILLDDQYDHQKLIKMSYDGRSRNTPWAKQNINCMGYHYYMTPETAALGIEKFQEVRDLYPKSWSSSDYPDLTKLKVFV